MKYVIVGGGIIGLYTAYNLLDKVKGDEILIVGEFLPGDQSINYTSPYAGGNFSCISGDDDLTLRCDKYTYLHLNELKRRLGPNCGVDRCWTTEFFDVVPSDKKLNSITEYLEQYERVMDIPKNTKYGLQYQSWSFNCPEFLKSMAKYLQSQGVTIQRKKFENISEAFGPGTEVVFNCTGLGSFALGGVTDKNMYPTRGQVVIVRAPHITANTMSWGKDSATYLIKRPESRDQLILGGFVQKGSWNANTYIDQTQDILKRTSELRPELLTKNPKGNRLEDLEILQVATGLRPSRQGGTRIEKEVINGKILIHNYGASGYGYQAGLGMGHDAVSLLGLSSAKVKSSHL